MEEIIRREFLQEWLKNATDDEVIEKLIQNDERAKKLERVRQYAKSIVDDEIVETCSLYDVNGIKVRKELENIVGGKQE